MRHVRWILLRDISSVALKSFEENCASLLLFCHSFYAPKVKVSEAEEKYKAIQDKLIRINEEAQALHPQSTSLKADVQARRKAVNETEVGKKNFQSSCHLKVLILSMLYSYVLLHLCLGFLNPYCSSKQVWYPASFATSQSPWDLYLYTDVKQCQAQVRVSMMQVNCVIPFSHS